MTELERESYDWGSVSYSDASHRYWLHTDAVEKLAVPSVTGVLSILDKPELYRWYEKMGIEGVREALNLNLINPGDKDLDWTKVVRENFLGAEAKRDAGAIRGVRLHDALRAYHAEGVIPALSDYEGPEEAFVAALQQWLMETEPEPIHVEKIVASPKHGFAGRFDLLAEFDDRRLIIDLKTRKTAAAYPADMIQLDGYKVAAGECRLGPIDGAMILAIDAHGVYATRHLPPEAEGTFLPILEAKRRFDAVRKAVRGS